MTSTSYKVSSARLRVAAATALLLAVGAGSALAGPSATTNNKPALQTAVFAGGCFWGIEAVFEHVRGVADVRSGYAGGSAVTANYETVSGGQTGHAEAVEVVFDPTVVSYGQLLKVFFTVAHDPTQLNRQTPDSGTQYRSAIFYTSAAQQRAASTYIAEVGRAGIFGDKKIVTQVTPLARFFPAESYHQDFARLNPNHPYIRYWDAPKVTDLKKTLPDLFTDQLKQKS